MSTKEPTDFCGDYPTFPQQSQITLPFGLPPVNYDATCNGLHQAIPNLNSTLAGIYPIIRVADCIMKVIACVKAVPDSLGPPPDPTVLIRKIGELAQCVSMLLEFSVIGAIPVFCKFIRDLIDFVIAILNCTLPMLQVTLETQSEVDALKNSSDPRLREMGVCLERHLAGLESELGYKFGGVALFVNLINVLMAVMPPPVGGQPPLVISSPLTISQEGIDALALMRDALTQARVPFVACAG